MKSFHDPITRNKPSLFSHEQLKTQKKNQMNEVIRANRNILAKLLSLSAKFQEPIDFSKALEYPLSAAPLSLAFPDGTKRYTQKSKLLDVITIADCPENSVEKECDILVVDLIAHYRTISTNLPKTFEELILRFLTSLPKRYTRVDLVADCYRDMSIKTAEREKRGSSSKTLIKSCKTKIPSDISKFYSNGENKTQLISLTFKFIRENPSKCLSVLKSNVIYLSGDSICEKVTEESVSTYEILISDQEEADTKVVLHAMDALSTTESNVCIRSPSGDTDIIVIAIGNITEKDRVKIDSGSGNKRKMVWLNSIKLKEDECRALIGFHAFSGTDYTSAFFRKGKLISWKKMLQDEEFIDAFIHLGNEWSLDDQFKDVLERYVCHLYSSKKSKVNDARFQIFNKKQSISNQLTDLSILPPCQSALNLHIMRANYVAKIWKLAGTAIVDLPLPSHHGWYADSSIQWTEEIFPQDITTLLLRDESDDEDIEEQEDDLDYESEEEIA